MRGGRILWGQIAVVITIVLVMTWAATQWVAFRLGFQPQLGAPWFDLAGLPVYYPPAFFWWWFSFDAYAPAIFVEGGIIAVSGGFIAIAAAILMSIIRAREARNIATYGSARWAEDKEIRAAGLLGPDGVVLGRHTQDYLRHDGPEHVLCFAPTRSGKGVGLVVWKLDRLGRSLAHLVNTVKELSDRKIGLRVLTGKGAQIDTTTASGRMVFGIFATLAEFERDLIRERTMAGLASARARGRKGGRKFALTKAQVRLAQAAMAQRDTSVSDLCKELGIERVTLYRYVGPKGELRDHGKHVLGLT